MTLGQRARWRQANGNSSRLPIPNLKAPSVMGSVLPTTSRVTPTDSPPSKLDAIEAGMPMISTA